MALAKFNFVTCSLLLTTYSHHQYTMAPIRTKGTVIFAALPLLLNSNHPHSIKVSVPSIGLALRPVFSVMAATSCSLGVDLCSGGHSDSATIRWVRLSVMAGRAAVCPRFPFSAGWFAPQPAFSSGAAFPLPASGFPTPPIATACSKLFYLPFLAPAFTT